MEFLYPLIYIFIGTLLGLGVSAFMAYMNTKDICFKYFDSEDYTIALVVNTICWPVAFFLYVGYFLSVYITNKIENKK